MGVTTTAELETYLKSVGIDFTSVEPLAGGTGNFVWRLTLSSGETRVVKHAEPYIRSNPDLRFDVKRIQLEADALSSFAQLLGSTQSAEDDNHPTVYIPAVHRSDPDAHILIMDDCGLQNLKAAYPDIPAASVPLIGAALGRWLAQLHNRTPDLRSHDNAEARAMYRYAYSNLASSFEKFGLDASEAKAIDAEFGAKLATDDEVVCHGDFWPGNVLVRAEQEGGLVGGRLQLSIVDWEITRRGVGATDVAQFAAESYLLDRFSGGKGLLRAFLEAYVASVKGSGAPRKEEFVRRLVVHFGVHVAFWPTWVKWCEEEETRELVKLGRDYLIAGRDRNWEAVRKGPLEPMFGLLE